MGDDERRRGPAADDEVAQFPVVALDRALTGSDADALLEGGAVIEGDPAFLGFFGGRAGIFGHVHADDADVAGGPHDTHQVVEDELGVLLAGVVMGLEADALHPGVDAEPVGAVHDGGGRVDLGEVDGGGPDLAGKGETVGLLVDDEDLGGAAQDGAVGRHQPDRAGAEDRHALAGGDHGQLGAVVAGREDVRQHGEVRLVVVALGELEQVEIGPRDPQQLGLPAPVGAHFRVAVPGARVARGVGPQARRREAVVAVAAGAAGQVERHRHPVAHLDPVHAGTDLGDDPHVFVAEDHAVVEVCPPLVGVQVRSADVGGGDPDDRVERLLDLGVGDLVDRDVTGSVEYKRFHGFLL